MTASISPLCFVEFGSNALCFDMGNFQQVSELFFFFFRHPHLITKLTTLVLEERTLERHFLRIANVEQLQSTFHPFAGSAVFCNVAVFLAQMVVGLCMVGPWKII